MKRVVLLRELLNLGLVAAAQVPHKLLVFIASALERRLDDLKLATTFIEGVRSALQLLSAALQFKPELGLEVLLYPHAQDVRVDGEYHLLRQRVELSLLALHNLRHLRESLLELLLEAPARGHLLN